jgi:hypothetical protein
VSTLMLTGLGQQTSVAWLLAAYALFGVGLGIVNPTITNSAVAGMPLSQAGVAVISLTSRQVGASVFHPDSMRINRNGNLFIALYDGGGHGVIRPNGRSIKRR